MSALSKTRGVNINKDDTRRMEDEARKMELKIELLRKQLDGGDGNRSSSTNEGCSRWKSGSAKKPLRNGYVKDVLATRPTRNSHSQLKREDGSARSRDAPSDNSCSHTGSQNASGGTTPTKSECQGTFGSAVAIEKSPADPGKRAATNLQAALQQQSREALEVEAFLAGLGLDRYVSLFMEHGFDCMEAVQEMQESHMREIGMATGHALKLKKRLAELNPAPAPAAAIPAKVQSCSTTHKRVSFGCTEEAKIRSPAGTGTGTGTDGGGLLDGAFDEEESKASFQEAVRAWREGRNPSEGSSAKDQDPPVAPKAPSSFWTSMGGDEVNLECSSTPVAASTQKTIESEVQHDDAAGEEKLCCYQCYKQFFAKYAVERCSPLPDQTVRKLCCDSCGDLWIASMQAKAKELQLRQEKLAKLAEVQRVMEAEMKSGS